MAVKFHFMCTLRKTVVYFRYGNFWREKGTGTGVESGKEILKNAW